jgi:2,4-dienoyl-CoA reductase-like NADH-dependent reductase (Old Yellow Enzyme family)
MAVVTNETSSILATDLKGQYGPLGAGDPETLTGRWPLHGFNPEIVKGYSKLAHAVHEHGGKCAIELSSSGMNFGNMVGVSKFPWPTYFPFTGREMDEQQIESSIDDYGRAAKYVSQSGLDAVDVHATHGTLICEFLSKVMNKRKDRYGGSLENRMRFLLDVLSRVRENVDSNVAVGMRLLGDERFSRGFGPEDSLEIARRLDGKVDWITADQGISTQQEGWQAVPIYVESGYNRRITTPMKNALRQTKVGIVGKYVDPLFAESLLANGEADMVAMTRALIADPELPSKAQDGRIWEIRPCIGVLQDLLGAAESRTPNVLYSESKRWSGKGLGHRVYQ